MRNAVSFWRLLLQSTIMQRVTSPLHNGVQPQNCYFNYLSIVSQMSLFKEN